MKIKSLSKALIWLGIFFVTVSIVSVFISYRSNRAQFLNSSLLLVTENNSIELARGNFRKTFETLLNYYPVHLEIQIKGKDVFRFGGKGVFYNICVDREFVEYNAKVQLCDSANGFFFVVLLFVVVILVCIYLFLSFRSTISGFFVGRISDYLQLDDTDKLRTLKNFDSLVDELVQIVKTRFEVEKQIEKVKIIKAVSEQVSHDIRSPLSALEMVSSQIADFPEEKRLMLRNAINRIRDIANSLNKKEQPFLSIQQYNMPEEVTKLQLEIVLLAPILDALITEKRMQYRQNLNVEIFFNQSLESYGLFAKINIAEFKRVISNIVDNAVEAISVSGWVSINLKSVGSNIVVEVTDNGTGISEKILSKIGVRGATFGKEKGTGLGLAHAKQVLSVFGGHLKVTSSEGLGTVVALFVPSEIAPDWFVPRLELQKHQRVVILDDDQAVHQIWKGRFESAANELNKLKLDHFASTLSFRSFYGRNFHELEHALFLLDYEILGEKETGLDIIDELGIRDQSILVTSRYEEPSVRSRCERMCVRLIPKSLSAFVPIELV